jgi:hypothetical protein
LCARRLPDAATQVGLVTLLCAGCIPGPGGPTRELPAGAAVRVTLDPPRDVAVVRRAGRDTFSIRNARELLGRVHSLRGDTVRVVVSAAQSDGRSAQQLLGEAALARGPGTEVVVLSRRPELVDTMGVVVVPLLITGFVMGVGFVVLGLGW